MHDGFADGEAQAGVRRFNESVCAQTTDHAETSWPRIMRVPADSPASRRSSTPGEAPGAMHNFPYPGAKRGQGRVQLGLHAPGGDSVGDQSLAFGSREDRPDLAGRIENAGNVGKEHESAGLERAGAGDRHLVGIDVEDLAAPAAGHARDHGEIPRSRQQPQQFRISAGHASHRAQRRVHLFGLHQQRVDAGEPDGLGAGTVERRYQFVIHGSRKHLQHGIEGFRAGDAQPVDEAALDAAIGQESGHLPAAPVDHHHLHAGGRCGNDLLSQGPTRLGRIQQRAAEFDQDPHSSASVSGKPSIRFMF